MKPLYLRLKGFIGIKNGLGLEEVSMDVSSLSGLIALVGTNGAGKTTFLDNLHPYRLMPSKTGGTYTPGSFSFYNETTGEAEKEFIFEMDGNKFKSILFIDQDRNKQEAYLYVDREGTWEVINKDGRVSTYDKAVEALVGSPRLYFNSIFRCQEAPRLNTYRKGVIKDILAELLLLSDIQEKGKAAKAVVDLLTQLIDKMKAQEMLLGPEALKVTDLARNLAETERILNEASADLKKSEARVAEAISTQNAIEIELATFKTHEDNRARTAERAGALERQLASLCKKRADLEDRYYDKYKTFRDKRVRMGKILSHADEIRVKVEEEKEISSSLGGVEAELKIVLARIDEAGKIAKDAAQLLSEINPLLVKQGQNKTAHQAKISTLRSEISRVEASVKLLDELPCTEVLKSRCPAVKATVDERNRLNARRKELAELEKGAGEDPALALRISELSHKMEGSRTKSDSQDDEKQRDELNEKQEKLKKQLADMNRWTRLMPELESAEASLKDIASEQTAALQEHLSDLDASMAEEDTVREEVRGVMQSLEEIEILLMSSKAVEAKKVEAAETLVTAKNAVGDHRRAQLDATGKVAGLKESLDRSVKASEQLAAIISKLKEAQAERGLWSTVERAFSNDGIIALEIDDAGPYVGSLANKLLSTCFGTQFSVRIDTQDMKADGTQAETFDITVIDNETGLASSLSNKSGGQKTWIEDAITKAIALFNAERSRKKYHTLFTDERDGALSQDVKRDFFMLKREALTLGGFTSEYFISHTHEAQDMADHKLVFQKGTGITIA